MPDTYRKYKNEDLVRAASLVQDHNYSIYKASKECKVPWSTLKDLLKKSESENRYFSDCIPKLGRPFVLPSELEQRIHKYILDMQELGFGLTVLDVRKVAYRVAESSGLKHTFNAEKEAAGECWWADFKKRYNLSLRAPENIAAYRSSMANRTILDDFYSKLDALLLELNIKDHPELLWNCDETGVSYVVKPNKVVTSVGKKYVYKRPYADRGENHTLLGCISASGQYIAPLVIFKGVRLIDDLKRDIIPGSMVAVSPKGWINIEIFLSWFQHFIKSIPPARPVVLLMDSHGSHVTEDIISLAKENSIYLFTFPPHTTHLLQPLDVGVYRPFKAAWNKSLNSYMLTNPSQKPSRYDFHTLMKPAYYSAFSAENIISSFRKTGICPLNDKAILDEQITTSKLTEKPSPAGPEQSPSTSSKQSSSIYPEQSSLATPIQSSAGQSNETTDDLENIFELPKATPPKGSQRKGRHQRGCKAKCLTPPNGKSHAKKLMGRPKSKSSFFPKPSTSNCDDDNRPTYQKDDDWKCGVCNRTFGEDVRKRSGATWVQCSFCFVWYHTKCQTSYDGEEDVFMCDICETDSDA